MGLSIGCAITGDGSAFYTYTEANSITPADVPPAPPRDSEYCNDWGKFGRSTRILFSLNSVELNAHAINELNEFILLLESFCEIELIEIVGHANDEGSFEQDLSVSEKRAESVKSKLANVFPNVPMIVRGVGLTSPIASNDSVLGRQLNRRVTITFAPKWLPHRRRSQVRE